MRDLLSNSYTTRFVKRSLRTRPHGEEGTRWTLGGGVLLISSDDGEDDRRIFWALNFRFREFLGRKICQVVFGLILIGIIWDIQNYLNFSFSFYVIAETEDVLGCLGCMLLRIFKFWYFIFRVIILCFLENLRLVNSAWDFLRLIFGPGISFLVEGGKGLSEALSIFFGGGFILSPFDHRHPLKFLFLGRPFKNMTVVSLLCSDQFSSNCKLKLFTKPGSFPENK